MENSQVIRMARLSIHQNILKLHSIPSPQRSSRVSRPLHAMTPLQLLTTMVKIVDGMQPIKTIFNVEILLLELYKLQLLAVHVVEEKLNTHGLSRLQILMVSMMVKTVHTL